uniref:Uncharacterized protein n=1 Tax=Anguilla anguilla TaxID=7936 RepID=A0A0E9P6C6_ANGAN
MCYQCQRIPL